MKKPYSLRWHLLILVLAAMIPFVVFSFVMVRWLVGQKREGSERALYTAAVELASSLDGEIRKTISTLQAISVNEALLNGDLKSFHKQMRQVLATQPNWGTIILQTRSGDSMLSALHPYGEKLVTAEPASVEQVFERGEPVVGNITRGPKGSTYVDRYAFSVRVPVFKDGKVIYALSALVDTNVLQSVISPTTLVRNEWTRVIVDSQGTVAARTLNPDRFVGQKTTSTYLTKMKDGFSGVVQETSLEGDPVYMAITQAPFSKWTATVLVPIESLQAPTERAQTMVLSIGTALLLIFGGMALYFSQKLVKLIRRVTSASADIGEGKVPEIPETNILEMEQLRQSLLRASDLIRSKEKERNEHLEVANVARSEAEKANKMKSEFVANMSHELRTPLGIIHGMLDLYTSPEVPAIEKPPLLDRIRRNADYLSMLIDQVLDLSKVEMNALEVEKRTFDIRNLLEDLVANLRVKTEAKGVRLKLHLDSSLPTHVKSDPLRVRQILLNLLGNAVKFTQEGEINVYARKCSDKVEVRVKDTGIGMTDEQKSRLFKPFTQGDNSMTRRFGGTGLGLAVSKRLAEALGGDIKLLNASLNLGSEFVVEFKDSASLTFEMVDENTKLLPQVRLPSLEGMRVLVVDDSADNRFILRHLITIAGADVVEAEDGYAAIKTAMSGHFDCVLMDIQMPLIDGNQATAQLRRIGYSQPIIAVTAHAMKSDRDAALKAGYTDYLTKPINRHDLIKTLAQFNRVEQLGT